MRVAMVVSPTMELYPLRVSERDAVSLLNLVYESPVTLDDDREPAPGLATGWEVLNEGRTWMFTIRDNVYFHDGRKLTAYDVAATMTAIKNIAAEDIPDNQKGLYWKMPNYITSWEAEDNHTLRVRTDNPSYSVLYAMTFPVLQAQSLQGPNPPGTGPYRVSYYAPGEELMLDGNENWWSQMPYVSEIVGVWYQSDKDALLGFEKEEVDILMTRSPAAVRYRGTLTERINSYTFSTRQLECLLMNYTGILKGENNVEMRKAIAYAIDRSRLITNVYQNIVTATDTIQSSGSWLYNDGGDVVKYPYRPEESNRILDSLGYTERNEDGFRFKRTETGEKILELRLCYYDEAGNGMRKEAADEIANMLRAVGFRIRVNVYGFESALEKLAPRTRDYDLCLAAYNFDVVPDPSFMLSAEGAANHVGYNSAEIKTLLKTLKSAGIRDEFQYTWYNIQSQVSKELPLIPLYWRNGVVLTQFPYSKVRDIREFELLKSIESYQ